MAGVAFHRIQLMQPARLVPDAWMRVRIGSVDESVSQLQRFRDAGADETATYGSTPGQNAGLIEAWRGRTAAGVNARAR
jgi:hypothetical protein